MIAAPLHPQEDLRLRALAPFRLLDAEVATAFDDLAQLAATVMKTPIALVSMVDQHRQWFKAKVGLDGNDTPREQAFCAHAILNPDEAMVVEDATQDPRFSDNPSVCGSPNVRFYAGVPLKDPKSQLPLGTLCVISDQPRVFDRQALGPLEALARQAEALFSLALKNRDLQQANTDLALANERVHRATQEKSRFLATMSHEIRTPMNGIIGTAELMSDEIPPQFSDQLSTIRACSTSLLHLINDVLDLSKIEAGHFEMRPAPVDVNVLVGDALSVVTALASGKGLRLEPVVTGCPEGALLDAGRVHQILLNLLSNAVKFTQLGGVKLLADLQPTALHLIVKDSGPGLSPEDQARVFEPFVQTGEGVRVGGGTGLGLSICRALAHAMGGRIELVSSLGNGCEFHVHIPTTPTVLARSSDKRATTADLAALRVLVVEDNAVNVQIALGMLKRLGVQHIRVAQNGKEALTMHQEADVILMDCQMPVLDGYGATRAIRAAEGSGSHKPIIALTASAFESDRDACESAGMNDVLTKPLRREALAEALVKYAPR